MVDSTEGHIYPTFGLAHSLRNAGHSITYLSVPANERMIGRQGFEVSAILHDPMPPGIIQGGLDTFFDRSKPDLLVINIFLLAEALILHYRYKIWPVILTPYLPFPGSPMTHQCTGSIGEKKASEAVQIVEYLQSFGKRSTDDILRPVSRFPELVLCPRELETNPLPGKRNSYYIQPSIHSDLSSESELRSAGLPEHKKILYASLGSNAGTYENKMRVRFYKTIINTIVKLEIPNIHLVMAVGRGFDTTILGDLPGNVTVVDWAPQVAVLKTATLAIIHGGLGSIKECIYCGVPMIAIPMGYDQYQNGEMIRTLRLGITRRTEEITGEILLSDIRHILEDQKIKENIGKMQQLFTDIEASQPGTRIIESLLKHPR